MKPHTNRIPDLPPADVDPVDLPENAFSELAADEEYRPVMHPARKYPEATLYSVGTGLVLAVIFSAAAAYLGLKVGQVFEAAIPIAIIAVGLSGMLGKKDALGQNIIIQSIGACSGVIVAGAIFTLPALYILKAKYPEITIDFLQIFLSSLLGGILGILFFIPFRKYFVKDMHGKYPFPEATATTQVLVSGNAAKSSTGGQAKLLITASLIGGALLAEEIEIWTDIDGMHNNDPRFVENTTPVEELHFEEAAELAYFGAKILHPTCVLPAKLNNIPVRLLNTMQPDAKGTLIYNSAPSRTIKAIAAKDNITAIKIKSGRMLLAYGFLRKVFEIFETYRTPIDMIATSEVGVSVTIDNERDLTRIVDDLKKFGTVTIDHDMVIICVVGDMDWQNMGFEARALDALKDIPVRMISYGGSNFNISFLVRKQDKVAALQALSSHLFKH